MTQSQNFKPFLAATMVLPILAIMFPDASQTITCYALGLIASALCLWRLICLLIKVKPGNPTLICLASVLAVFFFALFYTLLLKRSSLAVMTLFIALGSFLVIWCLGTWALIFYKVDEE